MKICLTLILSFSILISGGQTTERKIQTIIVDLNSDRRSDTISIYSSLKDSSSFNKIVIAIAKVGRQSFQARNEWTTVDSTFLSHNENLAQSNKVFLYKAKTHAIILLFGVLDGAGYREDFSIISIKNNRSLLVFDKTASDQDIEMPITLTDIDHDNRTEFIFRNFGELYKEVDSLNADIGTYNPYFVYTIDSGLVLNKPLTRKYNEDNYVFAGYQYSEKIKVLYPRDKSRPKIIK